MSRWVRIQADVFEHPVFAAEPFSEREAWLWLIAKAAWRETRHRVGSSVVSVPEGSLFVTLREMQAAWRWRSDTRVRTFLRMLENERMILVDSNAGKTQITICNYSEYQNPERTENAEITHGKRTENALKTPIHQNTNTSSLRSEGGSSPVERAVAVFSEAAENAGLPAPRKITADRRRRIEARIREHGEDAWAEACRRMAASSFCRGENDRGWRADLDFICQPKSFNGLLEGKYDDRPPRQATSPPNDRERMNSALDYLISGNGNDSIDSANRGSIEGTFQRLALPARD